MRVRARRMGVTLRHVWTAEDDARLRKLIPSLRMKRAAARLGRTYSAIESRLSTLGITTGYHMSADEIDIIREACGRESVASLARRLGRSYTSVWTVAQRLRQT